MAVSCRYLSGSGFGLHNFEFFHERAREVSAVHDASAPESGMLEAPHS